jgi:exonuclease SbcD
MRLLHTSDWHLGHTLYDQPRAYEHARFLEWLLELLERERIDALLLCGDVFDAAHPGAEAQATWYRFLADARLVRPTLQVVVVGGNHDSPTRLEAPDPLLRALNVRVVGGLPGTGAAPDLERLLVPLRDESGEVRAHVAAVPFLRPADLPPVADEASDPLVEGVRQLYATVVQGLRARRRPGQAMLAMGHLYMVGTELSELSERKILGGNQHALPGDLFPEDLAYVALGHLHLGQAVGGREHVRYSGSPLPLALGEAGYRHEVVLLDLDGERVSELRRIPVPRIIQILRVPEEGAAPMDAVLHRLHALPLLPSEAEHVRPYLEVCVQLEKPEPGLRRRVEDAIEGRDARLVKLTPVYTGHRRTLAEAVVHQSLRDLTPEQVFLARYFRSHQDPPSAELLAAFHELVVAATRGEGGA